jgi:hypothetical protein
MLAQDWHPETYTYVSGHANIRVYDGTQQRGGLDPMDYVGEGGALPPFRDGTEARFAPCDHCHRYDATMHVQPLAPLPLRRWLCADCCPARAFPHL